MKILMTTYTYPAQSAPGRMFYLKDHAAVAASIADTVICDNSIDLDAPFSFRRRRQKDDTGAQLDQWILTCRTHGNFLLRRIVIFLWYILSAVHIAQVAIRERPDAGIQHFYIPNGLTPALMSLLFGYPFIVVNHSSRDNYFRRTIYRKMVVRLIHRIAKEIWYVSEPQLKYFDGALQDRKSFVLGNPINAQRWQVNRTSSDSSRILVLNMAYPSHRKGTDILIKAVRMLKEKGAVSADTLTVAVVGKGQWDREYRDLASSNHVDDIVQFRGFLSVGDLDCLVRDCSFSVLPSRDEGFSYAVAESLAAGKPVVTAISGGPEWFVTPEMGLVAPRDNLDAFAAAFEKMLHTYKTYDPQLLHDTIEKRFGYPVIAGIIRSRLAELTGKDI